MRSRDWKSSTSSCEWILIAIAMLLLAVGSALGSGCAATKVPPIKTYKQAKAEVAKLGPLVDDTLEKRLGYKTGKSVTVPKDTKAPFNGNLMDEDKTRYYIALKAERNRRRAELQAAREKAEIQRRIYESTINHLKAKAESRNTWWSQNKGLVGFAIGVTIGMAIVTGLTYALTKGQGASTTTNAHIIRW